MPCFEIHGEAIKSLPFPSSDANRKWRISVEGVWQYIGEDQRTAKKESNQELERPEYKLLTTFEPPEDSVDHSAHSTFMPQASSTDHVALMVEGPGYPPFFIDVLERDPESSSQMVFSLLNGATAKVPYVGRLIDPSAVEKMSELDKACPDKQELIDGALSEQLSPSTRAFVKKTIGDRKKLILVGGSPGVVLRGLFSGGGSLGLVLLAG